MNIVINELNYTTTITLASILKTLMTKDSRFIVNFTEFISC